MEEISGIPATQPLRKEVGQGFGHLEGLDLEALDAKIRETGRFEASSLRLVRPTGEVVFRHICGDVLEGGAGTEEAVVAGVQDVTDREFIRIRMSRYFASEVAALVLAGRSGERIGSREVEVAILVADMRNFAATAAGMTPEELFETLNAYLEPLADVVVPQRGMIDKLTGDGFMDVFGLASTAGDEADRALEAALELPAEVGKMAEERSGKGTPVLDLGFGVH